MSPPATFPGEDLGGRALSVDVPLTGDRPVAIWLLVCCAMIFAMVVIGGVTRLTESGLSITEWQPLVGVLPPLAESEWQAAFAKYQQIPEYEAKNTGMTLAEFKTIFWWEYAHRLWGRLIGVAFLLPLAWFVARGRIRDKLAWRLAGIFIVGGLQGTLGWYMVQSGLVDRIDVSPYRLTAHLGLALLIYVWTLWTALDLLRTPGRRHAVTGAKRLWAATALVFLTILAGGFVAGLDAGRVYNSFPLMDGRLVPVGYFDLSPWWLNWFENPAAAQFNHRLLGMTSLAAALAVWLSLKHAPLDAAQRRWVVAVPVMAALQAALGIATLLLAVPIALAALHQAGAVLLLSLAVAAAHALARGSASETTKMAAAMMTTEGPDGVSKASDA